MFTIKKEFNGKVKRLSLHFQDASINGDKPVDSGTIFGTLQVFQEGIKNKVKNINFSLPMDFNKDLKNHIVSIIGEAIKLSEKKK